LTLTIFVALQLSIRKRLREKKLTARRLTTKKRLTEYFFF